MRASGILLPVSSLPSKYGIGCFSAEAYEFVDQLARAGQKYWQILPLGPTGYGDSPYQSFSTFAGNPYFIDLEAFVKEGYLDKSDCEDCDWGTNESYVDYEKIYNSRFRLLRKAFENYDCETDQEYRKFVKENAAWLEDYSLYMAIKDSLNGISWIEWPTELKNREKAALAEKREKLAKEVDFFSVGTNDLTQYTLAIDRQNQKLDAFYDPHHPAVLAMIRMAAENAHAEGKWIGICGELGADLELTEEFLSMGLDELSVSPAMVLPLRKKIRESK